MIKSHLFRLFVVVLLQISMPFALQAAKITLVEDQYTPDIAFFNEKGEKVFLDQFEGKTVLLVFWATWCAPCITEMPDLDALQKDFRKLPFEVVAVSEDFQGITTVKEYFRKEEIRRLKIYHDYGNALFKAFEVAGLPSAFIIDPDGKIVVKIKGSINWFEEESRELLLSYIPGNPATPKNSYKESSLNKEVKSFKKIDDKDKETQDGEEESEETETEEPENDGY
jgi:thiol-disulfide isomerase/thioredoxin